MAEKKPAVTAKDEAKGTTPKDLTFTHNGTKYTIPAEAINDLEVMENLEDEKYISVARQVLGRQQWARFKELHRGENGRIKATELDSMLEAIWGAGDPTNESDA